MATKMFYIAIMMRKFHLAVIANIIDYLIRILFGCEIHSQMVFLSNIFSIIAAHSPIFLFGIAATCKVSR